MRRSETTSHHRGVSNVSATSRERRTVPTLNLIQRYRWISVLMLLVANGSGVVASTRDAAVHGGEPRGHPAPEQARRGADGDAGEVAGDAKWEEVANCRAGWVSTMVGETSLTISRRATVAEGGNEHNVPFPNVPAVSTCGTDAPANRLRLGNTSANMTEAGCGTGDTGEFGPRRVWATRRGTSTPWATMGPWKRLRPHRASDLWELARGTFLATTLPLFAFQAAIAGGVVSLCVYMHAHWVDFDGLAMAICCSVIVLIAAGLHLGWKKAKKGVEARDAAGARTKHPWAKRPPRKPWGSACLMVYALLSGSRLADIEKPYGQVGGGDNVSDLSIGATPRAGKEGDGTVVEGYFLRCRGSFIWNVGGHLGTAAVPLAPQVQCDGQCVPRQPELVWYRSRPWGQGDRFSGPQAQRCRWEERATSQLVHRQAEVLGQRTEAQGAHQTGGSWHGQLRRSRQRKRASTRMHSMHG